MTEFVLAAFATGWGAKFGGINSFNTDLISAFGNLYNSKVTTICFVIDSTDGEIDLAIKNNVTLVRLPYKPEGNKVSEEHAKFFASQIKNIARNISTKNIVCLGHDIITGEIAIAVAKLLGCKSALIHHMSYIHYEGYAENSKNADIKAKKQKEIFMKADYRLAVGPFLRKSLSNLLDKQEEKIDMVVPGFPEIEPRQTQPVTFTIFFSGRLTEDTKKIKQQYLGVAAYSDAVRNARERKLPDVLSNSTNMILLGAEESRNSELENELIKFSEKYAGARINIQTLSYTENREDLYEKLKSCSLALMPSWHEGFGLVAWEAIAAGVPIIISEDSGVFLLIEEDCDGAHSGYIESIRINGLSEFPHFKDEDLEELSSKITKIANDKRARKKAEILREKLKSKYSWKKCAETVATLFGFVHMEDDSVAVGVTTQSKSLSCQTPKIDSMKCASCLVSESKATFEQTQEQRERSYDIKYDFLCGDDGLYKLLNEAMIGCASFDKDVVNSRFVYAHGNSKFYTRLIGEGGESDAITCLRKEDDSFRKQYKLFEKSMNDSYNPQNIYVPSKYYVETHSFDELDCISRWLSIDDENKNFYLIGEKGSGKTITQNCWLHKNRDFFDEQKIYWIRCDAYKLYRFWEKHYSFDSYRDLKLSVESQEGLNLDKYFDIQFLYVIAKYFLDDKRILISSIREALLLENFNIDYPEGKKTLDTRDTDCYSLLINLNKTIQKEEYRRPHEYSYAFNHLMVPSNNIAYHREQRKWLAISTRLRQFLNDRGYKFLKIVDGVDQVHINNPNNKSLYKLMIEQAYSFAWRRAEENEARLLVLRERTLIDIKNGPHQNLRKDMFDYCNPVQIGHEAQPLHSILDTRLNYVTEPGNNVIDKNTLYGKIVISIKDGWGDCNDPISYNNEVFHNNCRSYLHNILTLSAQVYYRFHQLSKNNQNTTDINVFQQVAAFRKRNLFLNGRLFLNTYKDWPDINNELGAVLYNIFYYNVDQVLESNKWHGLVNTRILQSLLIESHIEYESLVFKMTRQFGYQDNIVVASIDNLRAFGLIDTKELLGVKTNECIGITFEISQKGKYFLKEIYTDIDILYYLALDTPIPESFVENDLLHAHNNKFHRKTYFPYSSITSSITFLLFLAQISNHEIFDLVKNGYNDDWLDAWRLPCFQSDKFCMLIKSFELHFDKADDDEKSKIVLFLNKLKKFVS